MSERAWSDGPVSLLVGGIELQPEYAPLIRRRVLDAALPLVELMEAADVAVGR